MDNMGIRKAQLEKLDAFVKTLYDETQVFSQYMNMKDLEMLYLHIHELIEEMLQCKNTDEFMKMIEDLHRAVAGVLIIAVPANASTVKADMKESYSDFEANNFDEMLANLQKTSVQKYANKTKPESAPDKDKDEDFEDEMPDEDEDPKNDPDELIGMLDLQEHVKHRKQRTEKIMKDTDSEDTEDDDNSDMDNLEDLYKQF